MTHSTSNDLAMSQTPNLITVEPDLDFEERIRRGNYGYSHPSLTAEIFSVTADQVGVWEWKLFSLSQISLDVAIDRMHDEGSEPGEIGHILAFGAAFPEVQLKFCVVAIGSIAKIELHRYVPALWNNDDYGRNLGFHSCARGFSYHHRLLGVRRCPE